MWHKPEADKGGWFEVILKGTDFSSVLDLIWLQLELESSLSDLYTILKLSMLIVDA